MPRVSKYQPGNYDLLVRRAASGFGLFADSVIEKGACVIEYFGPILGSKDPLPARNSYLFAVSERRTIDGSSRANTARYINHSCKPNCEAVIHKGRVFIFSKRRIKPGEELHYNYGKEFFNANIKAKGCRCIGCLAKLTPPSKPAQGRQ
jgi:SET domain-containing protein